MSAKQTLPKNGELVVVKVTDLSPHSAMVRLIEYGDIEGMIHISEVSRTWVKDIRRHLKINQVTVAQTLPSRGNSVDLSLKRVNDKMRKDRMNLWNMERKATKYLERVKKELSLTQTDFEKKVLEPISVGYSGTFSVFEMALRDPDQVKKDFGEEISVELIRVAEQNITLDDHRMGGMMTIQFPTRDGLSSIISVLGGRESEHVSIRYCTAPHYDLIITGDSADDAKRLIKTTLDEIKHDVEENGGAFSFERR